MSIDPVSRRTLGQYPLSIATSLAAESANGIHPDLPVTRPPIEAYDELWVNVRTLFRNLLGSLDKEGHAELLPDHAAHALHEEMHQLHHLFREATHNRLKVVFYFSNYAGLEQRYKNALLRMDNTPKQKEYTLVQRKTMDLLFHLAAKDEILGFNFKISPQAHRRTAIITHYAIDLVNDAKFGSLTLLESHTGKFKKKAEWYTKYYDGKTLTRIPFREDFLQIFGDSETFRPLNPAWRKALIELAEKYNWTAVSTEAKLRYGIETLRDHYMRTKILEIMHAT